MARPFHFLTEPVADGDWEVNIAVQTRTIENGTEWKLVGGVGEHVLTRKVDASSNSDVQMRVKRDGYCELGLLTNFQDNNNLYLFFNQQSIPRHAIFKKVGGSFTLLGAFNFGSTDDVFENLRGTSADESGSKRLKLFIDGVERVNVLEATAFGSGRAGVRMFPFGGTPGDMIIDWWTFDTVLGIDSITPSLGGFSDTTPVEILGDDFGDGSLVDVGLQAAQNIVVTPPNKINCDFPPVAQSGKVDVTVKFGTP